LPPCESTISSDSAKISEDEIEEEEDIPLTATNRTEKTVMFGVLIRVPKAASESMVNRSRRLIHQNKFNFLHSVCYGKHGNRERTTQIKGAYSEFRSLGSRPFLYDQHVYYPDNLDIKANYITFVRDPVNRMVSEFCFLRSDKSTEFKSRSAEFKNKTVDECVSNMQHRDCLGKKWGETSQMRYVCGLDPRCGSPDPVDQAWALRRAKRHLEQKFSDVGVVEKMDDSLQVLEQYLPLFFRGISKIKNVTENANSNKSCKDNISDHAKAILTDMFEKANEYKFYHYAEKRLELQKSCLEEIKANRQCKR